MVDRLMPIGGKRSGWPPELPVEVDGGGEREDPRGHAADEAAGSPGQVPLEAELILERVHDRLDPLPETSDRGRRAIRLVGSARPQDKRPQLSDCLLEVAPGEALVGDHELADGRLSLERAAAQNFDLLAIDAFSGDSIPMHLITREAMATYVRHVNPDGVIVFQATNRFVDIAPVVERLAAEFGMTAVLVSDEPESAEGADYWISGTEQIVVTRNAQLLAAEPLRSAAQPLAPRPEFRVWTDDFYNLLRILK